jgi:hypothetical protein
MSLSFSCLFDLPLACRYLCPEQQLGVFPSGSPTPPFASSGPPLTPIFSGPGYGSGAGSDLGQHSELWGCGFGFFGTCWLGEVFSEGVTGKTMWATPGVTLAAGYPPAVVFLHWARSSM